MIVREANDCKPRMNIGLLLLGGIFHTYQTRKTPWFIKIFKRIFA